MTEVKENVQKGLTGFQLKYFAAFLMVLDHLYTYLGGVINFPIQFKWVGRIVAPIFVYMTVEGYSHTRNKKKYLFRLYIAHVLMKIGNSLIMNLFPINSGIIITNGMFGTMFIVILYLFIIDYLKVSLREKNTKRLIISILMLILPVALNVLLLIFISSMPLIVLKLIMTFIPLPLLVEEGLFFAILGIILYLNKDSKTKQLVSYLIVCLFFITVAIRGQGLLIDYQWMMIFAAPFIYLYNGKRGKGNRNFFYIFYPGHVYIIWIIAFFLSK